MNEDNKLNIFKQFHKSFDYIFKHFKCYDQYFHKTFNDHVKRRRKKNTLKIKMKNAFFKLFDQCVILYYKSHIIKYKYTYKDHK